MKTTISIIFLCYCFITNLSMAQDAINPKFDINSNPYEKILQDTTTGKRTAKFLKNFIAPQVLRDYFNSSPCNDYIKLSEKRVQQFQEFVQQFLSMPSDAKQMKTAEKLYNTPTTTYINDINYHIGYIEKQGTFTSDDKESLENLLCRAKGSVQAIKSIKTYLDAQKKVFPSCASNVDESLKIADEAINTYNSDSAIIALIKKNKN